MIRISMLPTWLHPVLVGGIAFTLFLTLWPQYSHRLSPLTGDEPFYVMTAISLFNDRDVEESNNYVPTVVPSATGPHTLFSFDEQLNPPEPLPSDWQGWPSPPRLVEAHAATTDRPGLYSKHGLGLPLLIAMPWRLASRFGAVFVIISAGAFLAGQMYLLGRESGAKPLLAGAIAIGIVASIPVGPYALLLFPEVPAALLLIYAIRRVSAPQNESWQWLLTGSAVGFLPWLHQRFAPTALILAILLFVNVLRSRDILSNAVLTLTPVFVGGVSLLFYNQWLYGIPIQRTEDHAGFNRLEGAINGGFGLLLDAQWGLLISAPVYIFALASIPLWMKHHGQIAKTVLISVTPYLVVIAAYKVWWGEWGPPARYLVPIVPLAAGPLAFWLRAASFRWRLATYGLWTIGMLLTIVGYQDPQRFYHHPNGVNNLVTRFGDQFHVDMQQVLVPFQTFTIAPLPSRFWISFGLVVIVLVCARSVSGITLSNPIARVIKSLQKNLGIG